LTMIIVESIVEFYFFRKIYRTDPHFDEMYLNIIFLVLFAALFIFIFLQALSTFNCFIFHNHPKLNIFSIFFELLIFDLVIIISLEDFLIGPQFPFRLYKHFFTAELFANEKGEKRIPSTLIPTMRCIVLGAIYLGVQQVLAGSFPSSFLATPQFQEKLSFIERLLYFWIICKVTLTKYLGVWLIGEGPCTLVGINFAGYNKDGSHKGWRSLSNVDPFLFESSLNLQGIVDSFNINTNDWVKRYVFKRLKWVGNRNVSAFSALFFLAIWHGLHVGYFLCFCLEYFDMEAEKKIQRITAPFAKYLKASGIQFVICSHCI